ncbi:upper zone of growth plate and cartilage matrix associated a [Callorhinchus milii]|uniref:Unique cartilage matrix-associated protein n=1 Tax=Callorhinchus milii TaxID=7868 RepID=V9LEV8_CALMI|nr:upper zone of growth plate and cartilage matrix associated a [Callorhinchus milii]
MRWKQIFLSCLAIVFTLAILKEVESAAVRTDRGVKPEEKEPVPRQVFVTESDASRFFKRRTVRSVRSRNEYNAENRQRLTVDERRKENHEEQLHEWENYVEEERDEQYERTREKTESWREWHYDGLYPSYQYNRHVY